MRKNMLDKAKAFETVSEWQAAGGMETGFYVLERVKEESERAIGFVAQKYNGAGNLRPAVCWMPKCLLMKVKNDFYQHGPEIMYLVPCWLYNSRIDEGYEL